MRRFALSEAGARELLVGCAACMLQNVALMLPVGLLYSFIMFMLKPQGEVLFYLAGVVVCVVLILASTYFQYNSTYLATYRESGRRRISLAERLRKIPLSFFMKKDLAELTASIMNDCATLETSQSHFLAPLIGSMASTLLIACPLFAVDWRMALAALWVLPVAFGIVGLSAKVQHKFSRSSLTAKTDCEEGIQELLECAKDLRSNNFMHEYTDRLSGKIKRIERVSMSAELGTALFVVSAYLVLRLGIASVALVGAVLYTKGTLSAGVFVMFMLAASRLYDPLEVSLQNLAAVIATRAGAERMNAIFDRPLQTGTEELTNRNYDVEFRHVSFGYDDNEVLHDVSFTAKQGEVTALVGPSGGGKTTVSRLIVRFWDADEGAITIGGMDVRTVEPEALMSLFSIVFQDVTLFNSSVLENIRLGRKGASDDEAIEAGKLANCHEFVERLPQGWDTLIGENGCELSGGERQRISIARAFLKGAPVVLLDEATASLDTENESVIQGALSRLVRGKTVIVIAHRLRTVMGADKVVVLADKGVYESGSPEELLKKRGMFAGMVEKQK